MQRVFLKQLWQWSCPSCYHRYASVAKEQCRTLHRSSLTQYSIHLTSPLQYHSPSFHVTSFNSNFLHLKLVLPVSVSNRKLNTSEWTREKEQSKVEQTVKALKEEAEKTKQEKEQAPLVTARETKPAPAPPKRSLGKIIIDEIIHYYHGFRLLFIDIKVSTRLVWKILNGGDLSRREHRQLVRTVSDLFRILPFSVFIIIPFMEFLLPLAIRLFPAMLPSTFETKSDKELKMKKELKVKLEMAKFLQHTLDEMAVDRKGDKHSQSAKEFVEFFEKIRTSGEQATNEEIIKYSKLFEDEITLDSLGRLQIIALCRLLELQPIGTNNFLRFQLRMKLRNLRADDQMIQKEGVDILTVNELQAACRARGMRALGLPEHRLRSQLQQWLELSLNKSIPPSLLLLSRALYLPENLPATEQLKATISTLPDKVATEAKLKIGEKEGKVDNRTKIEVIKHEEAAIKREQEERQKEEKEKLEEVVATAKAVEEAVEKESVHVMQEATEAVPISLKTPVEDIMQDAAPIVEDKAKEFEIHELKLMKEKEEELSKEDFDDLEDALQKIAEEKKRLLIEKEELEDLKEEMADYKEDIEEFKEVVLQTGKTGLTESKAASRLYNRVDKMIVKMHTLVDELSKERKSLQEQIDTKVKEGVSTEKERDNIISINELVLAIRRIQKVSDDTRLQRIADVLERMDIDKDGAVEIDHCMKVIELLGKENVKVTARQMNDIIELLMKEETLEIAEKLQKQKARLEEQSLKETFVEEEEEDDDDPMKDTRDKRDQKAVKNPERG